MQEIKNLTQDQADEIQAKNFNHATQDLYEAIEREEFPEWELNVQIMEDGEHPELDFDPLDPTKIWPEDQFPFMKVGKMVLNKNPENYFNEVEQAAFGTGVLVDGLDFSDDKLLQGRTFSYSDTQRYRVGPNYLQLPVNKPRTAVATNQQGGQMTYHSDIPEGVNPHVNYEPSTTDGLKEAERNGKDHTPHYNAKLVRQKIERTNDFKPAGERYRWFEGWEREDLIKNLINTLAPCDQRIKDKMVELFTKCDEDYGRRVREGLEKAGKMEMDRGPMAKRGTREAMKKAGKEGQPGRQY